VTSVVVQKLLDGARLRRMERWGSTRESPSCAGQRRLATVFGLVKDRCRVATEHSVEPPYRPVRLGNSNQVQFRKGAAGVMHIEAAEALAPYPARLLDRLVDGAREHPDRTLIAQRHGDGWRRVSYAQMREAARSIATALVARGLSPARPVAILSGNDIEHLMLSFGAMWAGIPHCPISAAYSLASRDFGKLRHVLATLTPGLIFASDGAAYGRAIEACVPRELELILGGGEMPGRPSQPFAALLEQGPSAAADAAFAATGPETLVKLLFTSGSTTAPKAVATTNRMLTSNQQMLLQALPFLRDEPQVQVDWLPWNHTFGGSHNLGIALYNGGSYYIDGGRPTPTQFSESLRNLKEIAPTLYFTVPKAWEDLASALETDVELAKNFMSRVQLFMYAGAGLTQAVWDRLEAIAIQTCGEKIRMITGLGMTEASPSCTFALGPVMRAGHIGLPVPGCRMKLVPMAGKLEARFAGPHVFEEYWRNPEQTAAAFDDEGYYRTGDALKPVDADHPQRGFVFDGRLVEDFKLSTGTFVSVGPLRARVMTEGAPLVQDAVIAGLNRNEIAVLIFPRIESCRKLAELPAEAAAHDVLRAAPVRAFFQALIDRLYGSGNSSSTRVARGHVLVEPPSSDDGESTDKNSINQRAVLERRSARVDAIYDGSDPDLILPRGADGEPS
jgi:feruloyl-CoA synthase